MTIRSRSKPVRSVNKAVKRKSYWSYIFGFIVALSAGYAVYCINPPPIELHPTVNIAAVREIPVDKCEAGERAAYTNGFQAGHDKR